MRLDLISLMRSHALNSNVIFKNCFLALQCCLEMEVFVTTTVDDMATSADVVLCWVSIVSDIINFLFGMVFIPLLVFKFFEAHQHEIYIKKVLSITSLCFVSASTIVPLAWMLFRTESCYVYRCPLYFRPLNHFQNAPISLSH